MINTNIRIMFSSIKNAEIDNAKSGKNNDQEMVSRITNYLMRKAKEGIESETEGENNEV